MAGAANLSLGRLTPRARYFRAIASICGLIPSKLSCSLTRELICISASRLPAPKTDRPHNVELNLEIAAAIRIPFQQMDFMAQRCQPSGVNTGAAPDIVDDLFIFTQVSGDNGFAASPLNNVNTAGKALFSPPLEIGCPALCLLLVCSGGMGRE